MLDHIVILDDTWRKCDLLLLCCEDGCLHPSLLAVVFITSSIGIFAKDGIWSINCTGDHPLFLLSSTLP